MSPVLENFTTNASVGAATSLDLDQPADVTFGDTGFILVGSDDNAPADRFGAVAGWDKLFEFSSTQSDVHLAGYIKGLNGSEPATETVPHTTLDNLWGAYCRISGAGGAAGVVVGTETAIASGTAHVAAGFSLVDEDVMSMYAVAFDGADADFSITDTDWTAQATIKSGSGGADGSGTFGIRVPSEEGPIAAVTITSTVADGSIAVQIIFKRATVNAWALRVAQQTKADVEPGISGWVATNLPGDEATGMRQFIFRAQATVGMDPDSDLGRTVRELVYRTIILDLDATATPFDYWNVELAASPGNMQNAVNAAVVTLQAAVDAESA